MRVLYASLFRAIDFTEVVNFETDLIKNYIFYISFFFAYIVVERGVILEAVG